MAEVEAFIKQQWPVLKQKVSLLEGRKRLLQSELEEIERELEKAKREFEAIDNAAKAFETNLSLFVASDGETNNFLSKYKYGDVTIKQAIRLALYAFPKGLDSHDLLVAINHRYFENRLARTSFSPQLSRLKKDREIEAVGDLWILTDRGRNHMNEGAILPYRDTPTSDPETFFPR